MSDPIACKNEPPVWLNGCPTVPPFNCIRCPPPDGKSSENFNQEAFDKLKESLKE